jgi:hypothetical protein
MVEWWQAEIKWLPADQGGRAQVVAAPILKLLVSFDARCPSGAVFDLTIHVTDYEPQSRVMHGNVALLAPGAPREKLDTGAEIDLFDGPIRVAHARITGPVDQRAGGDESR